MEAGATPTSLPRALAAALVTATLALAPATAAIGCGSGDAASAEAGPSDAQAPLLDLCDAFTGVGTTCPVASPIVCFPMCEAGGCFCSETPDGARWSCVTDTSCEQVCAPIDDACAAEAASE